MQCEVAVFEASLCEPRRIPENETKSIEFLIGEAMIIFFNQLKLF
jgi:hypothetical protein